MLRRSYYLLSTILVISLCLVSCSSDDDMNPTPTPNTVIIRDNFFEPAELTVAVGRTVIWRNQGSVVHTATSGTPVSNPGALFDSNTIPPGGGFTFVFSQAGTVVYFCKVHGVSMSGRIIVR
jgi:plastocyanin